jgi:fatty acid/phospholipid biosynthesis enzyme
MGGDHAPAAIVDGAIKAAQRLDVRVSLVGPAQVLKNSRATRPLRRLPSRSLTRRMSSR